LHFDQSWYLGASDESGLVDKAEHREGGNGARGVAERDEDTAPARP
jgi:hypothetical protein